MLRDLLNAYAFMVSPEERIPHSEVAGITYRLLRGPFGDVVRQLGIADSQTQRIVSVIDRLKRDYAAPLRTAEFARISDSRLVSAARRG